MGIELFLNDYYDLLKLMHDNEVIILDEKVIPLTQQIRYESLLGKKV